MRITLTLLFLISIIAVSYASIIKEEKTEPIPHWITCEESKTHPNQWTAFRKTFKLKKNNIGAKISIAVDTKYWLWINGELVVWEGGLKRGANREDTYYDEIPIAQYLKKGENIIAILVWHFGNSGFSHLSSQKAGLLLELKEHEKLILPSDSSWKAIHHPAYYDASFPLPNFRLSEPNVCFDAQRELGDWKNVNFDASNWKNAIEIGEKGAAPWKNLIKRPIPQWKNYGLKPYSKVQKTLLEDSLQQWTAYLPYNAQVTPYFEISADQSGDTIRMQTDNYWGGGEASIRAEYVVKSGLQTYESLGWMNGQKMIYTFPKNVKVLEVKFRETGYATEFVGSFHCNDDFYNQLWKKSRRTLYLCMRDSYMDCPDRERAQWWGDAVNEIEQSYYAFDTVAYALARKGIKELLNWQREDNTLFSPIPSVMWDKELPNQMLAAVGKYGIWRFYLQTGEKEIISFAYPFIKSYLSLWTYTDYGVVKLRKGDWLWGDWGTNQDWEVIQNAWYYLALTALKDMALVLDKREDAAHFLQQMEELKIAFNKNFWQGKYYRSLAHDGEVDDRANALAVLAELAPEIYYPDLQVVLANQQFASPFMERFVLEALFRMNCEQKALNRMKMRYREMVVSDTSTLWEHWHLFKGATINHGWSGSPLHLLSGYVAGIKPLEAGYNRFQIKPQMGNLKEVSTKVMTPLGTIAVTILKDKDSFVLEARFPAKTTVEIGIPCTEEWADILDLENKIKYWNDQKIKWIGKKDGYYLFEICGGQSIHVEIRKDGFFAILKQK